MWSTQLTGQVPRTIITDGLYAVINNSNPAHFGQEYVLWLTGLGYLGTTGDLTQILDLQLWFSDSALYEDGLIGSQVAAQSQPLYAGVGSGFPGMYQINFVLPANAASQVCAYAKSMYQSTDVEIGITLVQGVESWTSTSGSARSLFRDAPTARPGGLPYSKSDFLVAVVLFFGAVVNCDGLRGDYDDCGRASPQINFCNFEPGRTMVSSRSGPVEMQPISTLVRSLRNLR